MYFTSQSFIAFLVIVVIAYYLIPKKLQWPLLLAASLVFYAFSGWFAFAYMAVTSLCVYFFARKISDGYDAQTQYLKEHQELTKEEKAALKQNCKRSRKIKLYFGVLILVFELFISRILPGTPLGMSFYTLMALSYLFDVERKTVKAEKNYFKVLLYLSFFPLIIQGPISRFGQLSATLYSEHSFDKENFLRGFERILWGFFKKLVVADRLLPVVSKLTGSGDEYFGAYALLAMILYTVELYADFTGGIDITIGIAQCFGIGVAENFDLPYFSKSLKEYWRRWHISMCSWFREYVFYPVSSTKWMIAISRKLSVKHPKLGRKVPVHLASLVTWFATGLWHGSSSNFIIWGLLNWFILMVSEELEPVYKKFHEKFPKLCGKKYDAFQIFRTFILIAVLNIFDCYSSAWEALKHIFSIPFAGGYGLVFSEKLFELGLSPEDYVVVILSCILMFFVSKYKLKGDIRDGINSLSFTKKYCILFGLFVLILIFGSYGIGYDAAQFIYNRF